MQLRYHQQVVADTLSKGKPMIYKAENGDIVKQLPNGLVEVIKNGCLHNKTPQQKKSFFTSLLNFKDKDIVFYNEQLRDLKDNEANEFNKWILKQTLKP